MLNKYKLQLQTQLEDAKLSSEEEGKRRQLLFGKFRNIEREVDGAREQVDEEVGLKEEVLRHLKKAIHESDLWRQKYETEIICKAEELEMSKMKLQARLTEAQGTIEHQSAKLDQAEKAKFKLQDEAEGIATQLDQAHIWNSSLDKNAKEFDANVCEWKGKFERLRVDFDVSQKDCRNAAADLFRVKSAYEESILQLEEVRRENKCLSDEIKDIFDQIGEGSKSIHEIHKITKRIEAEKLELQVALEEAETSLEHEENKVIRDQLELTQVRQEIERRVQEKEEQFEITRMNYQKALDGMQVALEHEGKGKAEAIRVKKKLEADVIELETSLEHSNAQNEEIQKCIKTYHTQTRQVQLALEEEQRDKEVCRDHLLATERKAHTSQNALEEVRTLLEQSDKARRLIEQELSSNNETLSDLTCRNQSISGAKRKLDVELQTLYVSLWNKSPLRCYPEFCI